MSGNRRMLMTKKEIVVFSALGMTQDFIIFDGKIKCNGGVLDPQYIVYGVPQYAQGLNGKKALAVNSINGLRLVKPKYNFSANATTYNCVFKLAMATGIESIFGQDRHYGVGNPYFTIFTGIQDNGTLRFMHERAAVGHVWSNQPLGTFDFNKWHMVSITQNSGAIQIYMDGVLIGAIAGANWSNDGLSLFFGLTETLATNANQMLIDSFDYKNVSSTAQQILDEYNFRINN